MNDLQRELRAAFDRQEAELGDTSGLRQRMLRKAMAANEPRRSQVFRTAVGLAAVLVAAAAVGTTVIIRELSHSGPAVTSTPSASPSLNPTPSAAATPMAQTLHVPLTTPVMLFHDPVASDQIDGITWDGTASGRVAATGGAFGLLPNPMGTLYAGFSGSGIYDRSGQLVARYDSGNQKGFAGWWADDGRHYCQLVSASALPPAGGEPATLRLSAPGEASRAVAQVGSMGDQFGAGVVACSVLRDRAMVVQWNADGSSRQFWVVQLSTGRILLDSARLGITMRQIVASADGQYIADFGGSQGPADETTIYSPSGSVLGHAPGTVQAFSWDGTLVVVTGSDGSVSVIRWRDGIHVWNAPHGLTFYDALPDPGSQQLAVALRNTDYQQTGGFPPVDVYVVGPDGQATQLLKRVEVAF